jgi:hypothetical protein
MNSKNKSKTRNLRILFKQNISVSQNKYLKRVRDFLYRILMIWDGLESESNSESNIQSNVESSKHEKIEIIMVSIAKEVSNRFRYHVIDLDIPEIEALEMFTEGVDDASEYMYKIINVLNNVIMLPKESNKRRRFKGHLEEALNTAFEVAEALMIAYRRNNTNMNTNARENANVNAEANANATENAEVNALATNFGRLDHTNLGRNREVDELMSIFKRVL